MKLTQADVAGILIANHAPVSRIKEFLDWHKEHPHVWEMFQAVANKLVLAGAQRFGAKQVGEIIRKDSPSSYSSYGLNNNWLSYYIRIWLHLNPIWRDRVEVRALKSEAS